MPTGVFRVGPVPLQTSAADVLSPPQLTGGVLGNTNWGSSPYVDLYVVLRHIRIVNITSSTQLASLYIGATAAAAVGTEFAFRDTPIPPNSYVDWYGSARLDVGEFLTGLCPAATSLVLTAEGEIAII